MTSGITRTLQPTCYPYDFSSAIEDGELLDGSSRCGNARTRLNSALSWHGRSHIERVNNSMAKERGHRDSLGPTSPMLRGATTSSALERNAEVAGSGGGSEERYFPFENSCAASVARLTFPLEMGSPLPGHDA